MACSWRSTRDRGGGGWCDKRGGGLPLVVGGEGGNLVGGVKRHPWEWRGIVKRKGEDVNGGMTFSFFHNGSKFCTEDPRRIRLHRHRFSRVPIKREKQLRVHVEEKERKGQGVFKGSCLQKGGKEEEGKRKGENH